jgi:putative ATP-dependent endonuclease of the OLD family
MTEGDVPTPQKVPLNMQLASLTVTNHSRLIDTNIEFRRHLVLVGANDVGKSSLLRCLDLLLGASTAQLYARIGVDDVRDAAEPMVVEATLVELTAHELLLFPDAVTVDPAGGAMRLILRLEVDATDAENLAIRRFAPFDGTERQLSRAQIDAIGWRMVGATQVGARDFRDDRNSVLDDILANIDLGTDKEPLQKLAEDFQGALTTSDVLTTLRSHLATQLSKATPAPIAASDLSFTTGAKADDDLLSDVRLQVLRDGEPRDLTEQSDGARALYAIALYDLVAESANIVAVDEPEIHLHPTSQRSLARLLRGGANQKVIATHSPDIVGRFDPEQIAVVRPGGEVVQPAAGFLAADQKLLAHWWVQNKLEPLTAHHIVVLEGPSDRIVFMRVAELLGLDLDRSGISILELTGAGSVGNVVSLFGALGFKVPLTLLIDEDARIRTAETLAVPAAELETSAPYPVFVSTQELEDEYIRAITPGALFTAMQGSGFWKHGQFEKLRVANSGPSHAEMLAFCKRHKVLSAIVVANMLTETTAQAIDSVRCLIDSLRSHA